METGIAVSYNPNAPYNHDYIDKKNLNYTVVNQPKFSGCIKINGKLIAVTEQGTLLDTDPSVCKRLMKNTYDRPYDYFTLHNSSNSNNSSSSHLDTNSQSFKNNDLNQTHNIYQVPDSSTFKGTDITKPSV
ncbi:hypothetical protein [Acinetobacter sp. MD2(2019)]|uniref:hypothetical protein n=1 Tax=Acinetobacter sp. MD2(2019) TaxID=2605273 RepID=UPI002D1ECC87|nr:hypothetical protein [Acinetobacter sp. MD2(2019)]MEB3754862.1 hypothetical protein [Acinetobacter sp. MD2(2019)]